MHTISARWAAPVVLGLAVVLAGCTGAQTPGADEEQSPLSEYFSAIYGTDLSPEEQEQRYAEENKEREELMATCMQEQGFEYQPVDQSGFISMGSGTEWLPDDREWVAQWGYGAVEWPGQDEQPAPEDIPEDPNADYVASLSESEQMAFYEALYGPSPTEEELSEDGSYEYNWETAGCSGWAQHEIGGEDPFQSDEFADVIEQLNSIYADIPSLPGMAELEAEWAACMDGAGYPGFEAQFDAQNSIYDKQNGLWGEDGMSEPDEAAMDALHEEEIELALADLDCREETDYRAEYNRITWAAEEQFIADHETELEALKAAAEQARS